MTGYFIPNISDLPSIWRWDKVDPSLRFSYRFTHVLITYWSTEKLNSFRLKLGDISTIHFYLHKPCVQQETARLWRLLLFPKWQSWCSLAQLSVTHRNRTTALTRSRMFYPGNAFHIHLLYSLCGQGVSCGRVQLHRRRAGGAPLIIALTLWTWGTRTHSDKGFLFYRLFPNTVTEFRLLQNVLFSPICKSSYRKSVCRIQPWLLCCELALFDQLSDTCT